MLLGFWALMVIFPFLWMVMTSLKTDPEILFSPWNLPHSPQLEQFLPRLDRSPHRTLFRQHTHRDHPFACRDPADFAMAAYVLARFEFPGGRPFFYILFIAGMMFPVFLALVPLFFLVRICT